MNKLGLLLLTAATAFAASESSVTIAPAPSRAGDAPPHATATVSHAHVAIQRRSLVMWCSPRA